MLDTARPRIGALPRPGPRVHRSNLSHSNLTAPLTVSSDIHNLVPLHSAFRRAMLNQEHCDHPMRMVTLSEHREPKGLYMNLMTGAARPVRATLHSAEALWNCELGSNIQRLTTNVQKAKKRLIAMTIRQGSASRETNGSRGTLPLVKDLKAKKRPIATHAKLEFELTNCNHSLLTISNRNKKQRFCRGSYCELRGSRATNQPISNRYTVQIEIVATGRKQTRASNSNRYNFRGSSISFWRSRFSVPSPLTPRLPDVALAKEGHSPLATIATPRPSNPSRPVLQWLIRTRYRLETAAGAAASKDLGVGKRETE